MRKTILALSLVLFAATAQAAIVYLKEGGRLEGTVVSSTDREVILETSQGRVSIDLGRVSRIDYQAGVTPAPSISPPPAGYRMARLRRRPVEDESLFEPRNQEFSFDFGFDSPLTSLSLSGTSGGGSANDGDTGPLFGMQYLYRASPQVAWGVEFHYYDRSATDSPDLLPSSESHVYGDTLLLMGVMKYSLVDRGYARPFVLFGLGADRTSTTIDAHPFPGHSWSDTGTAETRTIVDDSALGLAASARVGLDFGFARPSVFSLEAGWTGLSSASYSATPQGRALGISGVSGPINYFTFAGRWGWDF